MEDLTLLTGLLGIIVVLGILIRMGGERTGVPPLVGYILLGFSLKVLHHTWSLLPSGTGSALDFLGTVGVVFLLFGVGLKTDLAGLREALGKAGWIWMGNVVVSGGLGFLTVFHLLEAGFLQSVFLGVALTATSVGVTVGAWDSRDALGTQEGKVLLDVAELDDISAVVLMAVLFAVLPTLQEAESRLGVSAVAGTVGLFALKGAAFGLFCYVFAHKVEGRITGLLSREGEASRILVVSGLGLLIASLAGALGFSVAIGAFFAGIVFSVDPERIRDEVSFQALHGFFVPFFFLGLGFKVDPEALGGAVGIGMIVLAAAVVGKVVGTFLPGWKLLGAAPALLLGVSMVPRAEISMIVMERGLAAGGDMVSPRLFGAMVLVTLVTSTVFPVLTGWGLDRST